MAFVYVGYWLSVWPLCMFWLLVISVVVKVLVIGYQHGLERCADFVCMLFCFCLFVEALISSCFHAQNGVSVAGPL